MLSKGKILITDDETVNLRTYSRILEKEGYSVFTALNREETIEILARENPDLLLLDKHMGTEDGFEVLTEIKSKPVFSTLYVVMFSAKAISPDERATGLEIGADGYLTRPIENRELVARIEAFLRHKQAIDSSRLNEKRFRTIVEEHPNAIISTDRDLNISTWNKAAESLYGWREDEVIGKNIGDLHPTKYLQERRKEIHERFQHIGFWAEEIYQKDRQGVDHYIHSSVNHVMDDDGDMIGLIAVHRDITARKLMEQEKAFFTKRLEFLSEIDRTIISAESAEEIATFTAEKLRQELGCAMILVLLSEGEGDDFDAIAVDAEDGFEIADILPHFSFDNIANDEVIRITDPTSQSTVGWQVDKLGLEEAVLYPMTAINETIGILCFGYIQAGKFNLENESLVKEVAKQLGIAIHSAKIREQVAANRDELSKLAKYVISSQEAERQMISREIHDDAGQVLTALRINLEIMKHNLSEGKELLNGDLSETISLADATIENLRRLAHELRPPSLDTIGLEQTLKNLCLTQEGLAKINVDYSSADIPEMAGIVEISFYRLLQEALTNVVRHSKAKNVIVRFECVGENAVLSIEDDGLGFDSTRLFETNEPGLGVGLKRLHERFELINGGLEVFSELGSGTKLEAYAPLK